jgi:hypothetical protein
MTPLKRPEHIPINLRDIPEEIVLEYKLRDISMQHESVHIVQIFGWIATVRISGK